jgi:hypothetical protein
MPIDLKSAGLRYGNLTVAYSRHHDFACRCVCGRLVHVAIAALEDGTVTSCGCRPAPRAFWKQCRALRAQARLEIQFTIARGR